jgi:hypothetical protein
MSTLEVKAIQAPTGYDLDMPAGHIVQTVSNTYSTQVNNNTSSYADTGLTGTITPKFATSKVLVIISQALGADRDGTEAGVNLKLLRGSTEIQTYTEAIRVETGSSASKSTGVWSITYLDSPATTSATTYKTTCKPQSTANNGLTRAQWSSTPSTITLMEVAQ